VDEDPAPVDFARDVLPILSDRCYACHGPDGAGRKAGLRLDLKEHAFADRDGFPALVPGDLEASELAARIRSEFPEEQMPPPDSNYALSEEEVQLLERWIQEGAVWEEHWAFVPPARPILPAQAPAAPSTASS
jgi:mono/diheme cytochrome c family protein